MSLGVNIALVLGVAILLAFSLAFGLWWGIGEPTITNQPWTAKEGFEFIKIVLTVVGGIGGVVALVVSYRKQRLGEAAEARENTRLFGEDFARATEQLGSSEAPVRLAGMYILERLAESTPKQQQAIINVLCAYLRMPYTMPGPPEASIAYENKWATQSTSEPTEVNNDKFKQEREARLTAQRIIVAHLNPGEDSKNPTNNFWAGIHLDLTGATLIDFNINQCRLNYGCFDKVDFKGRSDFARSFFGGEVSFSGASFEGSADFSKAYFSSGVKFNSAQFNGYTNFSDANFEGAANLSEAEFGGTVHYDGASFRRHVNFEGARFGAKSFFMKSSFEDNAIFTRLRFAGQAKFVEAYFGGDTSFDGAQFDKYVNFDEAKFEAHTSMAEAHFHDSVWFDGAYFSDVANFDAAQFSEGVRFINSRFDADAIFTRLRFGGQARFAETFFGGHTRFDSAQFLGLAIFVGAQFVGVAGFVEVQFDDEANFSRAEFSGPVSFIKASARTFGLSKFSGIDLTGARVRVDVSNSVRRDWPENYAIKLPDSSEEAYLPGREGKWGYLVGNRYVEPSA